MAVAQARRSAIAEVQRNRLLIAAALSVREHGFARVSVADVIDRAGVSRRTFYQLFDDCEQCLAATLEEAIERAERRVLPAWSAHHNWRSALRASLLAFLLFLDEERTFGTYLLVDSSGAGEAALMRRLEVLDALVDAIDRGRRLASARAGTSRLTAEGALGAVLAILHARLLQAAANGDAEAVDSAPTVSLLGQLMAILVLPYLGAHAAAAEARRPLPAAGRVQELGEELGKLEIRLTFRTVMVLRAIAARPGASNREVGSLAGVADQGQISKLLARLAQAALVENAGGSRERGEANAWQLTAKGAQVERTIRAGR